MQNGRAHFAVVDAPPTPPGLSLIRRQGRASHLEAAIDGGELFVDPARLVFRAGSLTLARAPDGRLASVRGNGRMGVGHRMVDRQGPAGSISMLFVVVAAGGALHLTAGAILAATPCPRSTVFRAGHGGDLLLVQAPEEDDLLLVLAAEGAASYRWLGPGQAIDIAPDALLAADAGVDLAAGDYLQAAGRCAFVQCLGPGGIALQRG
jgi:hypothetical protein